MGLFADLERQAQAVIDGSQLDNPIRWRSH